MVNYRRFVQCLKNTILLCVLTVPISTLLALLVAVALHSIKPLQKALHRIRSAKILRDLGKDAGLRDPPVGKAQPVKLPLDHGLGLKLLPGKLRVLMKRAAERNHICVVPQHRLIQGLLCFGHGDLLFQKKGAMVCPQPP